MTKTVYVLLDIDGVVGRAPWQHCANWSDHSNLTGWLAKQTDRGWQFVITFVTDRPAGNLELLCYTYHATETFQIGESGGAAYDPLRKWQWPNPQFEVFQQTIRPDIIDTLRQTVTGYGRLYQEETGGRLVTVGIVPSDQSEPHEVYPQALKALEAKPYFEQLRYEIGKVLVLYPRQLDKRLALQWHEELFLQKQGQSYPWRRAIFIADGVRDMVAAQWVVSKGAQVAAVGNAAPEFKRLVQQAGGLVVTGEYEAGLQQILQTFIHQV